MRVRFLAHPVWWQNVAQNKTSIRFWCWLLYQLYYCIKCQKLVPERYPYLYLHDLSTNKIHFQIFFQIFFQII